MRSSATVKEHYENLLTGIYQEIQLQGNTPTNGWKVNHQPEYGVSTWTLTEDKVLGRTGTSGELQVKIFSPGFYDFVKTEDYLVRGQLVCDAAKKLIGEAFKDNPALRRQFEDWVDQRKNEFDVEVRTNCQIDPARMRHNGAAYFNTIHETAKQSIQQLLANVAEAIKEVNPEFKNAKDGRDKAIAAIEKAEKKLVMERGRPNIIKVGGIGMDPNLKMLSAQFTRGAVTVPSTERDGNYATKLSNHVLDCTAVMSNNSANIKVMIDGHSSYTPINDRTSEWSRIQTGTLAFKEKITSAVADLLAVNPNQGTKDNPINYSLSSMMMLTPLALKAMEDKVRKGESESEQVREARIIMELVRSLPQPMEVVVNGETKYVNFNHTFMNIPANELAVTQSSRLFSSSIQESLNARGFAEYVELMTGTSLDTEDTRKLKLAIHNEYRSLNYLLAKSASKEELGAVLEKVDVLEKVLGKKYEEALVKFNEGFNGAKKLQEVNRALQTPNLAEDTKNDLVRQQRFLIAADMFLNREYTKPENAYIFQALYLLSSMQKNRDIEIFCKSGEDRTGWMRVTLMAIAAYNTTNGRDPDFSKEEERALYHEHYVKAAHELSASLENTAYNSASRGLQVAGKCTTTAKPMECDKAMATLAKTVFKSVPQPTRSCELIDGRLVALAGESMPTLKSRRSSILFDAQRNRRGSNSAMPSLRSSGESSLSSSGELSLSSSGESVQLSPKERSNSLGGILVANIKKRSQRRDSINKIKVQDERQDNVPAVNIMKRM